MLNNFFTDSENLFKLLFVNGVLIVLIGLFYPLQKRDELDLKIVEYNSNVELLNRDIEELYYESNSLKAEIKKAKLEKSYNEKLPRFQAIKIKSKQKVYEQDKKVIEVENQKRRIDTLNSQQKTYDKYCKAFLVFGSLIAVTGLIGWSRLTYFIYNKEYSDFKTRNPQLNRISLKKIVIITIILGLLLIVGLIYVFSLI